MRDEHTAGRGVAQGHDREQWHAQISEVIFVHLLARTAFCHTQLIQLRTTVVAKRSAILYFEKKIASLRRLGLKTAVMLTLGSSKCISNSFTASMFPYCVLLRPKVGRGLVALRRTRLVEGKVTGVCFVEPSDGL